MKKFICAALVAIMMLSTAAVGVSANTYLSNDEISSIIQPVLWAESNSYEAHLAAVERMVEKANGKIIQMVNAAIADENFDLDELVADTNALAAAVIEKAEKWGIQVECVYTVYEIRGTVVYIDPLFVVKR